MTDESNPVPDSEPSVQELTAGLIKLAKLKGWDVIIVGTKDQKDTHAIILGHGPYVKKHIQLVNVDVDQVIYLSSSEKKRIIA
jgi:hypothetical protein